MIVRLLYTVIAILIFVCGIISNFFPQRLKNMMQIILDKELFFIPGIFEVASSLMILYFRYDTSYPLLIMIIGVLIFVDGIFYLTGNKILKETFQQILEMDDLAIRYYSLIFYVISGILVFSVM